jgi:hypothetical protein
MRSTKDKRRAIRARLLLPLQTRLEETAAELKVLESDDACAWNPAERLNLRAWSLLADVCAKQIKRKLDAEVFGV